MNVAVMWVIFAQTPPFLVLPLFATLAVSLFYARSQNCDK